MHISTLKDLLPEEDAHKFKKIGNIILDENKAAGYSYAKTEEWNPTHCGWVYILTENDRIIKIGMTNSTLNSRFSSYQAGTQKARNKGTCSVTNYNCSEHFRKNLRTGNKISIFAYPVEEIKTRRSIFGKYTSFLLKSAATYESALLSLYSERNSGNYPILCNNTSI